MFRVKGFHLGCMGLWGLWELLNKRDIWEFMDIVLDP